MEEVEQPFLELEKEYRQKEDAHDINLSRKVYSPTSS